MGSHVVHFPNVGMYDPGIYVHPSCPGFYHNPALGHIYGLYDQGNGMWGPQPLPVFVPTAPYQPSEMQPAFHPNLTPPQFAPLVEVNPVPPQDLVEKHGPKAQSGTWSGFSNDARRFEQQLLEQLRGSSNHPETHGKQPPHQTQDLSHQARQDPTGPKRGQHSVSGTARAYEGHHPHFYGGLHGPGLFRGAPHAHNYQGYNSTVRRNVPVYAQRAELSDVQWMQAPGRLPSGEVPPVTPYQAPTGDVQNLQVSPPFKAPLGEAAGQEHEVRVDPYKHFFPSDVPQRINTQVEPAVTARQQYGDVEGNTQPTVWDMRKLYIANFRWLVFRDCLRNSLGGWARYIVVYHRVICTANFR